MLEKVVIGGDLSKLSPAERMSYYTRVCTSLGVNPLTKPFQYITLSGRLTLYATRDCTDQLRATRKVCTAIVNRERIDDVYVVTARATTPDGRTDESIGAVNIGNLKGDALANALMKAETKAKRRVTLSIVGLGWLDETELETIRDARPVPASVASYPPEPEPPADPPHAVYTDDKIVSSDKLPTIFEAHQQHIREATTTEALRKVATEIKSDLTLTPEQRELLRTEWGNQKHVIENGE